MPKQSTNQLDFPTPNHEKGRRALERILSTKDVVELSGSSATTIWREFARWPVIRPVRLSPNRVGYCELDIIDWVRFRKNGPDKMPGHNAQP